MYLGIIDSKMIYGCSSYFSKELAKSLRKKGIHVDMIDPKSSDFIAKIKKYHATLSYLDIHYDHISLSEFTNKPHLSLLVDPALYFLHQCQHQKSFISCIDQKDFEFIKKCGKESFFFPHAFAADLLLKKREKKEIDLLYFGSYTPYEAIQQRWSEFSFEKKLKQLYKIILNEPLSIIEVLQQQKIPFDLWPIYHFEMDHALRMQERKEVIENIGECVIYGKGPFDQINPKAKIYASCSFNEAITLMGKAKVVLNTSRRFAYGLHERILNAIAQDSICLTYKTPYLTTQFPKGLLTYTRGQLDQLNDLIHPILFDEAKRLELAQQAKSYLHDHTFDQRAQTLLDFMTVCTT